MKIFLILLIVILTCSLHAQQEANTDTIHLNSLEQKEQNPLLEYGNEYNNPVFRQPLLDIKSKLLFDNLELRFNYNRGADFNFTDEELPDPSHILSPWYNQYMKSQKFSWLTYVLGTAQTAAVGYLAYKHIKKYGFLKSKK